MKNNFPTCCRPTWSWSAAGKNGVPAVPEPCSTDRIPSANSSISSITGIPISRLADVGNIKTGATLADTYAALRSVMNELIGLGKTVIILGGSHDLTLAQYQSYVPEKTDRSDLCGCPDRYQYRFPLKSDNFLMEMLTDEPNYIHHYNHIGFQSYYVHPHMLETMDKFRFDCFRVGKVKEIIEEMEPVMRNSNMLSFDVCAIAHAFAPANLCRPTDFPVKKPAP